MLQSETSERTDPDQSTFKVPKADDRMIETREQLENLIKDEMPNIQKHGFSAIECPGNSYSPEACKYLAEIIRKYANKSLWFADFSDMFTTRSIDNIPESVKALIDSIENKPIKELYLNSNAIGVRVVPSFDKFLMKASHLQHLNFSNCGFDPAASKLISDALL